MSNALPLPPKKVIGGSKFFFHVIIWLTAWGRPWANFKSRPSTPSPSPPSPLPSSIVVHCFTVLIELLKATLLILNLAFFAIVEIANLKTREKKSSRKLKSQKEKKKITINSITTRYTLHDICVDKYRQVMSWFYWYVPFPNYVFCCDMTSICVLLVSFCLDIFKSPEDWKLKSFWEPLNREI